MVSPKLSGRSLHTAKFWLYNEIKSGRAFLSLASEKAYLDSFLDQHALYEYSRRLKDEGYEFSQPRPYTIPKKGGQVRHCLHVPIQDRLILTASLIESWPQLINQLGWSQGTIDFNRPLPTDPNDTEWFLHFRDNFRDFRNTMKSAEQNGHLRISDIKHFSHSIDKAYIISAMTKSGFDEKNIWLWNNALSLWGQSAHHDAPDIWRNEKTVLPIGYVFTDILQKLVLDWLDRKMTNQNNAPIGSYGRYNDNLFVTGNNESIADKRHHILGRYTALSGFTLHEQSQETFAIEPFLQPLWDQVREEWQAETVTDLDYGDLPETLLFKAYETLISPRRNDQDTKPQQPLFNFILNRLGKKGIVTNPADLPQLASEHPDKASQIIKYVQRIGEKGYQAREGRVIVEQRQYWRQAITQLNAAYLKENTSDYIKHLYLNFLSDTLDKNPDMLDINTVYSACQSCCHNDSFLVRPVFEKLAGKCLFAINPRLKSVAQLTKN